MRSIKVLATLSCLALSIFGHGAAASKLHPNAEVLKGADRQRMSITRYSGHRNFSSQQSLEWELRGDKYYDTNKLNSRVMADDCESLLANQQKFPLNKMISTGYIKPTDLQKYIHMSSFFEPGQVNFMETTRDLTHENAQQLFGAQAYDRLNPLLDRAGRFDGELSPYITASMWTVSGQVLDTKSGSVKIVDMPWQKDAARAQLSREFDRTKYKFVWELGRTAQDLPKEAGPLAAAASSIVYQEMLALGGKLEDSYIMFHSFDEVNTKAYSMRFPGRIYPTGWTDKSDAMFLVPLSEVFKAFPPSQFSGRIAKLIELSGGALDDAKALEFLTRFSRIQFTLLDTTDNPSTPLALFDASIGAAYRRSQLIQEFGIDKSPHIDAFSDLLMHSGLALPGWNSGQYKDLSEIAMSQYFMTPNNAMEISNLDTQMAAHDPQYIERVLMGAMLYYLKSLAPGEFNQQVVQQMIDQLGHSNVKIGITVTDPALVARIRKLSPEMEHKTEGYVLPPGMKVSELPGQEYMTNAYINAPHTFLFSINQVVDLMHQNRALFKECLNSTKENIWARYLMLGNPNVF